MRKRIEVSETEIFPSTLGPLKKRQKTRQSQIRRVDDRQYHDHDGHLMMKSCDEVTEKRDCVAAEFTFGDYAS